MMDTKENSALLSSLRVGPREVHNRIAINAMECCDADTSGNPTDKTYRRYASLFEGDAGVIVVEALSVIDESRGREHQLTALPQNQPALARLVSEMRKVNPKPAMIGSSPTPASSPTPRSRSASA